MQVFDYSHREYFLTSTLTGGKAIQGRVGTGDGESRESRWLSDLHWGIVREIQAGGERPSHWPTHDI
jgi:hypothetical protein